MIICKGLIQPVTPVPSSAPVYVNPHWTLIICVSLCLVGVHPDSPTVLRIAECPSGSQLFPLTCTQHTVPKHIYPLWVVR